MAIAKKHSSSDDDLLKVGPDATATFDNSSSNPTEYASSENLDAIDTDEDELDDEDIDEEDEEEYDEEDDEEEEDEDDEDDDDEEEEDDHDLTTGPEAPSVYRKL
ncbi:MULTISPECIES: hypothetical protein [Acidobacteriaceae]|uniref:hypothetical protein n=1 Tax=Acidobacteriaceae TaxID=204434 RepID=UPI00131AB636|nr:MULTISPECIES: hypothetical protein [Acidobacteriaceae]MDW5264704.1 hypothetical protein [Edaphobacter sp.]